MPIGRTFKRLAIYAASLYLNYDKNIPRVSAPPSLHVIHRVNALFPGNAYFLLAWEVSHLACRCAFNQQNFIRRLMTPNSSNEVLKNKEITSTRGKCHLASHFRCLRFCTNPSGFLVYGCGEYHIKRLLLPDKLILFSIHHVIFPSSGLNLIVFAKETMFAGVSCPPAAARGVRLTALPQTMVELALINHE